VAILVAATLAGFGLFLAWCKTGRVVLPGLSELLAFVFYKPLSLLARKEQNLDRFLIECENLIMRDRFRRVQGLKIIVAPQCLRSAECRAPLDPRVGYRCQRCGRCPLAALSRAAEELGFEFYIVPGDSFVKRIAKERKPDAAIGIACPGELSRTLGVGLRMGVASAGVALLKDGCFMTEVDVAEVVEKMKECGSSGSSAKS